MVRRRTNGNAKPNVRMYKILRTRVIYTEIRVNEATASEVEESEKKKKKKKTLRPCAAGPVVRHNAVWLSTRQSNRRRAYFHSLRVQPVARTTNYVFGSALSPYTVYDI